MEVRSAIKDNPAITTTATIVVIVLSLVGIFYQLHGRGGIVAPPSKLYFTTDDGATYFADDIGLAPPFQRDGKIVSKVSVFKGGTGDPWVQYLIRYKPEAKARIEALAQDKTTDPQKLANALNEGEEVKAPLTGDTGWVGVNSSQAARIIEIRRPPGVRDPLEPVYP